MRKQLTVTFIALVVMSAPFTSMAKRAEASPVDNYSGPYFGANNLPPGCIADASADNPENICYHMRTNLNALDSPKVDVLVLVPVSPTAERDMRIMRQSVEMWEAGIDYLAPKMNLPWLEEGMDFHITVDYFDPVGGEGGEFTTYPLVDPEIVVIATNPVGGAGIGIDPVNLVFTNENQVPCNNVENPFDFEYWENLPGFNNHHESRSGTYVEDCAGKGGNICFSINGAIDPEPSVIDFFGLFDLASHEFGHCLTLGHVGDGAEGAWGAVPTNDIMAYNKDPVDLTKCVSTLDVEGVALRMSNYIDVNGDGVVDGADRLTANDPEGVGDPTGLSDPFQVQHPNDHLYASDTGDPNDCPQPDLGLVPGPRTDWTPTPAENTASTVTITTPEDGAVSNDGTFRVAGMVERGSLDDGPIGGPAGSYDDTDDDATSPLTEILDLDVAVTDTNVEATVRLSELWPSTSVASPTSYSLIVDGRKFDSFIRYAIDPNPMTWDGTGYMPAGTSSWDLNAKTVSFRIPRDYLANAAISEPYDVASRANFGSVVPTADDSAPEAGEWIGVSSASGAEQVNVYVDGALAGSQSLDTADGFDVFDITVQVPAGIHELRVDWEERGQVIASASRTVNGGVAASDRDGDGIADDGDNCPDQANADQADMDGDATGNVCDADMDGDGRANVRDSDMDGDGHSNGKEVAQGTDPADPNSYPGKG